MAGTRKINVIDAKALRSGTTNNKDWTLYEITATTVDGTPIDLPLKSFEKLDGEVEVEVEKQEHEKYGVSYMLKKGGAPTSAGARLGPKVDELRDRVDRVEQQVKHLLGEFAGLQTLVVQATEGAAAAGAERSSEARFGDPDDIPF